MTAGNNWQISHYGFSNDSASFMSGRYYYYTGEVVLYPHGHASDYLSEIMAQAPGHYALLMDKEFSYYGYYISSGPVVSAYQPCSVTEIPGPDINEVQFYQSYGCQTTTSDATWFVVDLSAGC